MKKLVKPSKSTQKTGGNVHIYSGAGEALGQIY